VGCHLQGYFPPHALVIPPGILQTFNKLEKSLFWAGKDKLTGGQCNVNWKSVFRPKEKGSLGIIDLEKFARALRLCCLWIHWKDPCKVWIGNKNPCDETFMDFFYVDTTITIGDGHIASLWNSPWLHGRKPKDIAPSIFAISTPKNFTVHKAYLQEFLDCKIEHKCRHIFKSN
jgi:hypothetical protein